MDFLACYLQERGYFSSVPIISCSKETLRLHKLFVPSVGGTRLKDKSVLLVTPEQLQNSIAELFAVTAHKLRAQRSVIATAHAPGSPLNDICV